MVLGLDSPGTGGLNHGGQCLSVGPVAREHETFYQALCDQNLASRGEGEQERRFSPGEKTAQNHLFFVMFFLSLGALANFFSFSLRNKETNVGFRSSSGNREGGLSTAVPGQRSRGGETSLVLAEQGHPGGQSCGL